MTELHELEDRARTLLQAAAETVDVSPAVEAVVPRRPVWPVLAAAAVVALLLVSVALMFTGDRDPEPAPPPSPTSVTVPQTLYMTTEQATRTLESAGLEVSYGSAEEECKNRLDRVIRSTPSAGATVDAGSTVAVDRRLGGGEGICDPAPGFYESLSLLDLARFGTTDLEFAPTVRIWVDGEVTQTLTAAQALDPDAWGNPSPLTRLVTRLETSDRLVTGVDRGGQPTCGPGDPPASLRGQEATLIDAVGVVDGVLGCSQVRVYGTAGGVTDVTSTEWTPASDPASGRVRLEARLLDDGRRIELIALPGESSCLEIQGIDERIRSCVSPPSERVPDVTVAIATWAIAQRSDTAPLEVYGTTSVEVTEVVVQFDSGGGPEQAEAQLLRVTDAAKLDSAGISEPFGLFFAELPPGTTAEDVNAVAFNANGEQLGTADFSHLQGQPPGAVIGGRPQS